MLGSDINQLLKECGFPVQIYDLPEFDLTEKKNIEQMITANDIIINCAAYTAVDQAEKDSDLCHKINAEAVGQIGELARLAGKYVIQISSDFVFGDDGNQPLAEDFPTNPLSVYGASKLAGEDLLVSSGCRNAIIRIEWTYGLHGNHFVSKIIDIAKERDFLKVVDDQYGAPTPTKAVAMALRCFLDHEIEGLYHFAADGYASRYDVAKCILDTVGIKKNLEGCSSMEFSAPAKRPLNSRFDCSKIDKVLNFKRPDWKKALEDFLGESKIANNVKNI